MFHFAFASLFGPKRSPLTAALPGDRSLGEPSARSRHAQALTYAARRRRVAASDAITGGPDLAYWKAGVLPALARAAALRAEPGFARLP